jgi:hypothetical protein
MLLDILAFMDPPFRIETLLRIETVRFSPRSPAALATGLGGCGIGCEGGGIGVGSGDGEGAGCGSGCGFGCGGLVGFGILTRYFLDEERCAFLVHRLTTAIRATTMPKLAQQQMGVDHPSSSTQKTFNLPDLPGIGASVGEPM